jgi:hypothetical protein
MKAIFQHKQKRKEKQQSRNFKDPFFFGKNLSEPNN